MTKIPLRTSQLTGGMPNNRMSSHIEITRSKDTIFSNTLSKKTKNIFPLYNIHIAATFRCAFPFRIKKSPCRLHSRQEESTYIESPKLELSTAKIQLFFLFVQIVMKNKFFLLFSLSHEPVRVLYIHRRHPSTTGRETQQVASLFGRYGQHRPQPPDAANHAPFAPPSPVMPGSVPPK